MREFIVCITLILGSGASLGNELCDDAPGDTFASDVCWLIEYVNRGSHLAVFQVLETDEDECTARVQLGPSEILTGMFDAADESDPMEVLVRFTRAEGYVEFDEEQSDLYGTRTCWTLPGEGIVVIDQASEEDEFEVCGPRIDTDRIIAKLEDLYSRC